MSSTLEIREDAIWMPSVWIYDAAISCIAIEVDATLAPQLSKLLEDGKRSVISYCKLTSLEQDQFNILVEATKMAFDRAMIENFLIYDRQHYLMVTRTFSELKALIRTDPRNLKEKFATRQIIIRDSVNWIASDWIYDLVLEYLSTNMRLKDELLATTLSIGRTHLTTSDCDLSSLESEKFRLLLEPVDYLYGIYGEGLAKVSYAPKVLAELAPAINQLVELVLFDPRA